jgi:hypothetical protein
MEISLMLRSESWLISKAPALLLTKRNEKVLFAAGSHMIPMQSLHQLSVSPEHAPIACHSPPEVTAQKSFEVLSHLQPLLWTH